MAINLITPKVTNESKDIIKEILKSRQPQKYLSQCELIKTQVNDICEKPAEYFSPFATTGEKLNRLV